MASRSKLNLNFGKRKAIDPMLKEKFDQVMEQHGILNINGEDVKVDKEDLEDLGEIGFGTCGHVYKMRHKATGTVMAVKQMPRNNNEEEIKRIAMDLEVVLNSRKSEFIVHCLGCFIFSSEVWICMELMATCFDRLLRQTGEPIPERILGKVTVATVEALSYLKDKHNVIHRDVKPSNILLDEQGNVKLCDFGISGRLVDSKAKTRSAGCAAYMAPERIEPSEKQYDIRADVWSLGITLVELATGRLPYYDCKTDFEVLTKVIECDPPRLPPNGGFSDRFYEFVEKCLTKDCQMRPKYKELMETAFIKYYSDPDVTVNVSGWYRALKLKERFKDAPSLPPISNGHSSLATVQEAQDAKTQPSLALHPTNPFASALNIENLGLDDNSSSSSTVTVTASSITKFNDSSDSTDLVTPPPRRSQQSNLQSVPPTPRRSVTASPKVTPPPRRSLTNSPLRTPTPNRNGLGGSMFGGLNRCFCDLKDSMESLQKNTSPILIQRFVHQRKQSMEGTEIHCLKCNNSRKPSSANAASGGSNGDASGSGVSTNSTSSYISSTYLNGTSNTRRDYNHPSSHLVLSSDTNLRHHYRSTDAYLNSSCDTSSSSSSNLSNSHVLNLQRFYNNVANTENSTASPRQNGNRYEVVQFSTTTSTTTAQSYQSPSLGYHQHHQMQSQHQPQQYHPYNNYYYSNSTASPSPLSPPPPPLYPRVRQDSSTATTRVISPGTPPLSSRVRSPPSSQPQQFISLPPRTLTPPETSQPITTRTVSRMTKFFSFIKNNNK